MSEVSKLSEITISELWQKYFDYLKKRFQYGTPANAFLPKISEAINESPVQTLDRADEIFAFIVRKFSDDTELLEEAYTETLCCLLWAERQKLIDSQLLEIVDEAHTNAFREFLLQLTGSAENTPEDEMTMKSDLNSQNI